MSRVRGQKKKRGSCSAVEAAGPAGEAASGARPDGALSCCTTRPGGPWSSGFSLTPGATAGAGCDTAGGGDGDRGGVGGVPGVQSMYLATLRKVRGFRSGEPAAPLAPFPADAARGVSAWADPRLPLPALLKVVWPGSKRFFDWEAQRPLSLSGKKKKKKKKGPWSRYRRQVLPQSR